MMMKKSNKKEISIIKTESHLYNIFWSTVIHSRILEKFPTTMS